MADDRPATTDPAHLAGMCTDWARSPACDGEPGLSAFLRQCGAALAGQAAEIERLRAALRAVLAHDLAEECQECAIGKSAEWAAAKALLTP
jgi:hypothetical protein